MKQKIGQGLLLLGLVVCMLALCAGAVSAQAAAQGDFSKSLHWTLGSDGTLTISGKGEMEDFEVDETPWEDVKEQVTKIVIQEGVKSIGDYAFVRSTAKEVSIPASVTDIGGDAFMDVPVQKYVVSRWSKDYSSDAAGCLYDKTRDCLVRYPAGSDATAFTVPSSVTWIYYSAFERAKNLTSVSLPDSVDWIGGWAFYDCENLKTVRMSKKIVDINSYAFDCCSALQEITFPNTLESIGESAFGQCESLKTVSIPAKVKDIGMSPFYGCTALQKITVDAKNKYYCTDDRGSLLNKSKTILMQYPGGSTADRYDIPNGVETIAEYAIYACKALKTVTMPNSVREIQQNAFYECEQLQKITFSNQLKTIGSEAFSDCTALTSVSIPDTVTAIGASAFYSCEMLASITLPVRLTIIENYTFGNCIVLKSITIPKAVSAIDEYAFAGCSALKQIKILNPKCSIKGGEDTIDPAAFIYGQNGSTAQAYARKYNRTFCTIDANGNHIHTNETIIRPAKYHKAGKKTVVCSQCGQTQSVVAISAVQSVKLSKTKLTYNGKKQQPKVIVKNSDGKKLKTGRDYTLKYASGSKKVGTYTVTITFKGNYSGQLTRKYKIVSAA